MVNLHVDEGPRAQARALAHLSVPDRRRPLVLDTALRIAVEDGIGSVSIVSVASAMGVTRPSSMRVSTTVSHSWTHSSTAKQGCC